MTRLVAFALASPAVCVVLAVAWHGIHSAFGIPAEGLEQVLITAAAGTRP